MLNLKLFRDLMRAKWQYAAIALTVVLGIAFYIAAYSAYVNLSDSYETSYRRLRFEHFGLTFNAAPSRVAREVRRVPGVVAAEGRLIEDVALELVGRERSRLLIGRLISIPTGRQPEVNQLKLLSGRWPRSAGAREILLEASFAQHHGVRPGEQVEVIRGPSRARLTVTAIVQSDEYLYVVRSKQELMPSPDTFGVMFLPEDVLGALVGKRGLINDIRVRVAEPASSRRAMLSVEQVLSRYEPDTPVPYTDQPSYQMLMQDVEGFRQYAVLFPAFFLSVAALAVYSLLSRLVHQQRPIIGLLRSLGFSRAALVRHYVAVSLVLGAIGGLLGCWMGLSLAGWTSEAYMAQLQVPFVQVEPRWSVVAGGFLIAMVTCAVGAIFPAVHASRILPAEAMRPEVPTFGRAGLFLDRCLPGAPLLWRLPLRNVFRHPRRTVSTLFGMVAGLCLMMLARGLLDSVDAALDDLVTGSYRYDLRLDYVRVQTSRQASSIRSWPGVVHVDPVLEVPVEFEFRGQKYDALVSGQDPTTLLHDLRDESGRSVRPTSDGGLFGPTLRKRLGIAKGDLVSYRVPERFTKEASTWKQVRVAGFVDEAIGTVAYMRREDVARAFRSDLELPPDAASAMVLKVAPAYRDDVRERLYDLPDAGSVLSVHEIKAMVERMMGTVTVFVLIMQGFGAVLALAMVFNVVTINVFERIQEVATIRTIGISRAQVDRMIFTENFTVALLGIIIGLPISRWFIDLFWEAASTPEQQDLFNFQVTVSPVTYVISALGILAVSLISQIPALAAIHRLNLAKAAKERSS